MFKWVFCVLAGCYYEETTGGLIKKSVGNREDGRATSADGERTTKTRARVSSIIHVFH